MNRLKCCSIGILTLLTITACGTGPGPDSISSRPTQSAQGQTCTSLCHSPQSASSPDPLSTNGTGASGKHVTHVTSNSISCDICHYNYSSQPTHFDGILETGDPSVTIVNIIVSGQTGSWINDTGPQTGSCANIACHGPAVLDWYGTAGLPDCTVCHTGTLDPVVINGSGTAGKHIAHVTSMNIVCTKCHATYPDAAGHMNATLDTGNPAVSLVQFDASNPSGTWTNDTGPQTGSCSSLACHGPTVPDWYGTAGLPDCTVCHTGTLDPLIINGSGTAGKHAVHVSSMNFACSTCHALYPAAAGHMNATLDTGNPAVSLVQFDATNPTGAWTNDTGPQTGTCAALSCHGQADWYGTAGLPAGQSACSFCHTGSLDPVTTNGSGTAGKHVAHVSVMSIECTKCHASYPDAANHRNGTLDTGNPAVSLVQFDASNPSGAWINDTGPHTGSCSSLVCHGPTVPDWYGTAGLPVCSVCHTGSLDPVTINGSGSAGKHAVHVSVMNIACAKCHAQYPVAAGHMNATLDTGNPAFSLVQFDATNPLGAWTNDTGPQTGSCSSLACHNYMTLDWYGSNTWTTPAACLICHTSAIGPRRQVLGAGGDFTRQSHHAVNYSSVTTEVVTSSDCLVCHDLANHMSGTIRLKNKDNAGQVVVYQPANPAGLEPFCLSCHDTGGATTEASPLAPFSDGNTLGTGRNVAGNKISNYWNSSVTTHKNNGLTCAGTGAPNTGCHGNNGTVNMHGSSSPGLLAQNMTAVIPPTAAFNANDYKLCFDCHSNYPAVTKEVVLGYSWTGNYGTVIQSVLPQTPYNTPIRSLFRDQYKGGTTPYDDTLWGDPFLPLHNYHLMGVESDLWFGTTLTNLLQRNYRGDAAQAGRITCTSCHNVHGTNAAVRSTYDELGITTGTTGADVYGSLPLSMTNTDIMKAYPMNCTVDCHKAALPGTRFYWHTPSNE